MERLSDDDADAVADRRIDAADQALRTASPAAAATGSATGRRTVRRSRRRRSRGGPGSTPRRSSGMSCRRARRGLTRTARAARPPTCCAVRSSGTVNWPCTSIGVAGPSSTTPIAGGGQAAGLAHRRGTGSPRCAAPRPAPGPPTRRTARRTDRHPREARMRQPVSPASAASTTAWIRPPSDRSWAAETSPSRDAAASTSASSFSRARSTLGGTPPRWSAVTCAQIEPSNSSRVSPSRISVSPGSVPKAGGDASARRRR